MLPPSGPLLNALARFDPFPRIDGPEARRRAAVARDRCATRGAGGRARASCKILGTACGLGVEGSGWVAAPGVVVTNAHVVAGEDDTRGAAARRARRRLRRDARSHFDPRNDLAVLRVAGLDAPALPLARRARAPASSAAILGFPLNGPFDVRAGARRARRGRVLSPGRLRATGRCERRLTSLRGLVRSGNSGGPMVDGARARRDDDLRRHDERAARAATACPTRSCASAANPVAGLDGPCAGWSARSSHAAPRDARLDAGAAATLRRPWARRSSSPRSRPSGATSRACCPGAFDKHEGYPRGPTTTSSPGRSATSCSSPSPTSTTPKFKKWRMADLPIVPDAVQARRARRALQEADERRSSELLGRDDVDRRSSTPATPAARAS